MDFKAITQLKLKMAYADMQKFREITEEKDLLHELFECDNRGTLFIHDDASIGYSVFISDTSGIGRDKVFEVHNSDHKDVFLWHIDGVLYSKDSKCDCVVLTNEYIGFVEFKANAANRTLESQKDNYEKASSQLLLTLTDVSERCKSVGIDLRSLVKIEAFAVFNRTVPQSNAHQKKVAADFLLNSEGIKLHFKNEVSL